MKNYVFLKNLVEDDINIWLLQKRFQGQPLLVADCTFRKGFNMH